MKRGLKGYADLIYKEDGKEKDSGRECSPPSQHIPGTCPGGGWMVGARQ